jgi:ParB-like chromosome segregation protein Spo0J
MKTHFYLGETKQYTKFNILDHNRELNNTNLKKIEESILEKGLQVPIIIDENYNIIDGQHRFYVLQKNKMEKKEQILKTLINIKKVKNGQLGITVIKEQS